jgi:tRNA pseudouridine38-40 synthase
VDLAALLPELNRSLGGDISFNSVQEVPRDFNLIQSVERKTYRYFFSDSPDFHPFSAAFMTQVTAINSFERMRENASRLIGKQDFKAFCKTAENKKDFMREILEAKVFETDEFSGGFFPKKVYCFEVTGTGFLHHQVRKMVSAIWYFSEKQISERLEQPDADWPAIPTAPADGLVLWETVLRNL